MHGLVRVIQSALTAAIIGLGTAGLAGAQPPKSPPPPAGTDSTRAHVASVEQAVKWLDQLIARASRGSVTAADREHTAWLTEVKNRLRAYAASYRRLLDGNSSIQTVNAGRKSRAAEIAQMNLQFRALQTAIENESRRFQTLSNASKVRHAAAMSAIRNIK